MSKRVSSWKFIWQGYFRFEGPNLFDCVGLDVIASNGEYVLDQLTDAEGQTTFQGLRPGYYQVEVRADKHSSYFGHALVNNGIVKDYRAFLGRDLVTYNWSVTETDIPDHYEFQVKSTFETNVPAPVVTVEPAWLRVPEGTTMPLQVDYTVSNHGLIAANDCNFFFGSHEDYDIIPLINDLGTIPAQTTVTIPVIIQPKAQAQAGLMQTSGSGGGKRDSSAQSPEVMKAAQSFGPSLINCAVGGGVVYHYVCGTVIRRFSSAKVAFKPCPPSVRVESGNGKPGGYREPPGRGDHIRFIEFRGIGDGDYFCPCDPDCVVRGSYSDGKVTVSPELFCPGESITFSANVQEKRSKLRTVECDIIDGPVSGRLYSYVVVGPNGFYLQGDGESVTVPDTLFGAYKARFTVKPGVEDNCAPLPASIGFAVAKALDSSLVDLDIDSLNIAGTGPFEATPETDDIEENSPGKIIPVNQNDDDFDGVIDYADGFGGFGTNGPAEAADNENESSFVPVQIKIHGSPASTVLKFTYNASDPAVIQVLKSQFDDTTQSDGTKGVGYAEYPHLWTNTTNGGPPLPDLYRYRLPGEDVKTGEIPGTEGQIRLWKKAHGRTLSDWIKPGETTYTAAQLGIRGTNLPATLYVEGIKEGAVDLKVEVVDVEQAQCSGVGGIPEAEKSDTVKIYVGNFQIGINADNDPESAFTFKDKALKTQGKGFGFWSSVVKADNPIFSPQAIDAFPLAARRPGVAPTSFRYFLEITKHNPSPDFAMILNIGLGDKWESGSSVLSYLRNETTGRTSEEASEFNVSINFGEDQYNGRYEFNNDSLANTVGIQLSPVPDQYRLRYHVTNEYGSLLFVGDEVKVTSSDIEDLYTFWDVRNAWTDDDTNYPDEFGEPCTLDVATQVHQRFINRDSSKARHLFWIHGYNNSESDVNQSVSTLYRKLYWQGFRGNLVRIDWNGKVPHGSLIPPVLNFKGSMINAFRAVPALHREIEGAWDLQSTERFVGAHSLGNHVMWEIMRYHQFRGSGQLFNRVLGVEAAIDADAFMSGSREEKVFRDRTNLGNNVIALENTEQYGLNPIRPEEELIRNSVWGFYNGLRPAIDSVGTVIHSYNPHDFALWAFRLDNYLRFGDAEDSDLTTLLSSFTGKKAHYYRDQVTVPLGFSRTPHRYIEMPMLMVPDGRRMSLVVDGTTPMTGEFSSIADLMNMAFNAHNHAMCFEPLPEIENCVRCSDARGWYRCLYGKYTLSNPELNYHPLNNALELIRGNIVDAPGQEIPSLPLPVGTQMHPQVKDGDQVDNRDYGWKGANNEYLFQHSFLFQEPVYITHDWFDKCFRQKLFLGADK